MKGPKLLGDIDSFKNKQQMGLFTFYIETQNPSSAISFSRQHNQKYSNESKTIDNNHFETKKICQYRINTKPGRRLRTLQACANSVYNNEIQDCLIDSSDRSLYPQEQFNQGKDLFNFKREKSKKLLQELLMKNEVDNEILHRFSNKKGIINPEKLARSKLYNVNGFPKLSSHVKSGYLSNVVKKMSKQSLQKMQRLNKNLSQELISPKQKFSINEMRQINEKLDSEFKLQQQKRFRPNPFPFNKKRSSSYLKESHFNQMHPNSNDRMIQKLKNSKKILQIGQKGQNQMTQDNMRSFRESQGNQSATASQSKTMNQITPSMTNFQINNTSKQDSLENQIDSFYFPRERLGCLKNNSKSIHDQRNRNHSEIQTKNQFPLVYNFSTLEKIYRPRLNSIANPPQMNRKQQNSSNYEKKEKKSQQRLETKKNLLMIVKKVKNQFISI